MHSGQAWRLGHRPALDGLRGIAILLVVWAHLPVAGRAPNSGAGGVTVFFALSGFLITALLLDERDASDGRISLTAFYGRRVRRLLPALAVFVAFWTIASATGVSPLGVSFRDVAGVLFYVTNWLMALGATIGHPMAITWSLAVEEQFYLLWPLVFLGARRWPRLPATVAVLAIIYSVSMRMASWNGGNDLLLYHRTDTRMDSLLLGCLLALAVKQVGRVADVWARLQWLAWVVLVAGVVTPGWWMQIVGVPFIAAAATCLLIAAVLAGGGGWLEHPVLRWFGRRSYAIYLWHYPLFVLSWAEYGRLPVWVVPFLALAAAEASWWLVERPFSRRSARGSGSPARRRPRSPWRPDPARPDAEPAFPRGSGG
jgi:peptidoglycan/LPS O-acetylase OafA/YrhL